jgi:hypothetical protein
MIAKQRKKRIRMELKKKKHRRNNQERFPSINGIPKWRDI